MPARNVSATTLAAAMRVRAARRADREHSTGFAQVLAPSPAADSRAVAHRLISAARTSCRRAFSGAAAGEGGYLLADFDR